jgi:hypothetical protein
MLTSVSSISTIIESSWERPIDFLIAQDRDHKDRHSAIRNLNRDGVPGGIRTPNLLIRSQLTSGERESAPVKIRTSNPQIRSLVLYPVELRAHKFYVLGNDLESFTR